MNVQSPQNGLREARSKNCLPKSAYSKGIYVAQLHDVDTTWRFPQPTLTPALVCYWISRFVDRHALSKRLQKEGNV